MMRVTEALSYYKQSFCRKILLWIFCYKNFLALYAEDVNKKLFVWSSRLVTVLIGRKALNIMQYIPILILLQILVFTLSLVVKPQYPSDNKWLQAYMEIIFIHKSHWK